MQQTNIGVGVLDTRNLDRLPCDEIRFGPIVDFFSFLHSYIRLKQGNKTKQTNIGIVILDTRNIDRLPRNEIRFWPIVDVFAQKSSLVLSAL